MVLAAGMGVALDRHPRGLATDGRLAIPVHGGAESGAIVVDAEGRMDLVRSSDVQRVGPHDEAMVELPILLWDGIAQPTPAGIPASRAAVGLTPTGRVIFARGVLPSAAPLSEALAGAGCTRALLLDRGSRATAFFDRTGTESPPRSRYDESVLYAVATPLRPRAFRFTSSRQHRSRRLIP